MIINHIKKLIQPTIYTLRRPLSTKKNTSNDVLAELYDIPSFKSANLQIYNSHWKYISRYSLIINYDDDKSYIIETNNYYDLLDKIDEFNYEYKKNI